MLFDPTTQALFTDEFTFIKKLCCPLKKDWEELQRMDGNDFKRMCQECKHSVINTKGLLDTDVVAIMRYDPSACLRIEISATGNTTLLNAKTADGCRIIHTARTKDAADAAENLGYTIYQPALELEDIRHDDRRSIGHSSYAAYLIPKDIIVGEKVFLEDLIETRFSPSNRIQTARQLQSEYAIWTGAKFNFDIWLNVIG